MAAELFDKIYGRYYYVVRRMLEAGVRASLTRRDMDDVCGAYSYRESALTIVPKLTGGGWALFEQREDKTYAPVLHHPDRLKPPLTGLQKSWLKSLLADPRARLFSRTASWRRWRKPLGTQNLSMIRWISIILTAIWTETTTLRSFTARISRRCWKPWNKTGP